MIFAPLLAIALTRDREASAECLLSLFGQTNSVAEWSLTEQSGQRAIQKPIKYAAYDPKPTFEGNTPMMLECTKGLFGRSVRS
jgi:hypothetical protein